MSDVKLDHPAAQRHEEDPVNGYVSVYQAIQNVCKHGVMLGAIDVSTIGDLTSYECDHQVSKLEKDKAARILETFKKYFKGVPMCIGGAVDSWKGTVKELWGDKIKQQTYLEYQDADSGEWKEMGLADSIPIEDWLKICKPAAFGDLRTQETVIDENVRTAKEFKAEYLRFKTVVNTFERGGGVKKRVVHKSLGEDELLRKIKDPVQKLLFPKKSISLVPYKINVYSEGGFFKPHVDTPVDPQRMVGTVVVCFTQYEFTGGELVISSNNLSHSYDWSTASSSSSKEFEFAAFFSDSIHEVKLVTSGHRVTLTYLILSDGDADTNGDDDGGEYEEEEEFEGLTEVRSLHSAPHYVTVGPFLAPLEPQVEKLCEIIAGSSCKFVGVLMTQKYTHSMIEHGKLKGIDSAIWKGIRSNFKAELVPVVVQVNKEYCADSGISVNAADVYSFSREDVKYLMKNQQPRNNKFQGIDKFPFIELLRNYTLLKSDHQESSEYTGNESQPEVYDNIYFSAAIILDIVGSQAK